MEKKIKYIVFLIAFFLSSVHILSQEWSNGISIDFSRHTNTYDSSLSHPVSVEFPNLKYDDVFNLKLKSISGSSFFVGYSTNIIFDKNYIHGELSLGLTNFDYQFSLNKGQGTTNLDTSYNDTYDSDSAIWTGLQNQNNINVSQTYPTIRFNLGYKRELFKFRNISGLVTAGFSLQRRFLLNADSAYSLTSGNDYASVDFSGIISQKSLLFSNYIGFEFRYNSHVFGLRGSMIYGEIGTESSMLHSKEKSAQLYYSKIFGSSKIGREQVLYDEYQHLSQTRAAEYRKGDKFSYLQFGIANKQEGKYALDTPTSSMIYSNGDSLVMTTEGYTVIPNLGLELMLNTYFTHRWLMGLGFGLYEETYNSYGKMENVDGSTTTYGAENLWVAPNNDYQEFWEKSRLSVSINSAVYISKRILKIDPFIKGSATMVMDYDVPTFLKQDPNWRSTSFFPIYKIGAGADIRLRVRSSRFLVFGMGADYNINPHTNFLQYYVRIGYYRKKKLKNQTY